MILEKCWAKLYGSYDAIDGNFHMIQVVFLMRFFTLFPELPFFSTSPLITLRLNSKTFSIRWLSAVIQVMSFVAGLMSN